MQKPFYKKWWIDVIFVFFLFIFTFISTFVFLAFKNSITSTENINNIILKSNVSPEILKIAEGENSYFLGNKNNPKITIVEFSDFACPVCKNAFTKMRELGIKYKDDIKIVFRNYPLISEDSINYALSAKCAGEQNKFWEMHDKLFINQEDLSQDTVIKLAQSIQLDINEFRNCVNTEKFTPEIRNDIEDGQTLGVKGTPTFFINGQKIEGDIPLNKLEEIINTIIKNQNP